MARDQFQTLTEPMYFTLLALGEVRNGAEITSWVEEITKGRIRLAPGTLYALLAQFLENDLIKRVEADQKGKHYIITDEGRDLLKDEVQRLRLLISNYENHFDKKVNKKSPIFSKKVKYLVILVYFQENGGLFTC